MFLVVLLFYLLDYKWFDIDPISGLSVVAVTCCSQKRKLSSSNFNEMGVEKVWGVNDETVRYEVKINWVGLTRHRVHNWSAGEHCSVTSSGRLLGMKSGSIGLGWVDIMF